MGPPLVFIPGMMCDARLYAPQFASFSGRHCLQFAPLVGADTVESLAGLVLAQAPEHFALAGLSMGGIVAMEVIRQAPDRVTHLALMDTNPLAEREAVKQGREPQIDRVLSGGLKSVMCDDMIPRYLAPGPGRDHISDLCVEMALGLGGTVFVQQSRALQKRPDQTRTLRRVTQPALILCGQEDRLCPPERHTLMAELIPHAELKIIPGAGHLPTLEQPEATNAALRRWLEN